MDKKLLILAAVGVMGGIGIGLLRAPQRNAQQGQDVFPAEKSIGSSPITRVEIIDDGKKTRSVVAMALIPYGIKPEQVSPTGYESLKAVARSYPKADWISVFMAEDSAMAEASNWVGVAELRNGKVTITGGIPNKAEIDSLGKINKPFARPTQQDLQAVAAVYDSAGTLASERRDLSQTLLGAGSGRIDKSRFFTLDMETTALHGAAKAMGKDPKELKQLLDGVTQFYWAKAGDPL